MPSVRFLAAFLIGLLGLAPTASATWSIILINTRTGEIAVGCATCLSGFDLQRLVPVVVTERGAACAQSFVDTSGRNRQLLFDGFLSGTAPVEMLQELARIDRGHQTRQYGIVDVAGRASGFTGTGAGAYAGDLTGVVGDIVYAVQGNVITGAPVLLEAERAIRNTPGDLGEKLMAAMLAARAMGGDGRCSCSNSRPNSCGAPPPSFNFSSLIAFMIIARAGDVDGSCSGASGCATGDYYFESNILTAPQDPVFLLQNDWNAFKASKAGVPDHILSEVDVVDTLPADFATTTTMRIRLRDRAGNALTTGGAQITVGQEPSGATVVFGQVTDNGDGTYDVPVMAGGGTGSVLVRIEIADGNDTIVLMPRPEIRLVDDPLWASTDELSRTRGGRVDFVLQPGPSAAGRPFVLLATGSGTTPGTNVAPGVNLPLNNDPIFQATLFAAANGSLPTLLGTVPASGFANARFDLPAGGYGLPLGLDLDWAYAVLQPIDFASNPVRVRIGM